MDQPKYKQLRADVETVLYDESITLYRMEKLTGVSRATLSKLRKGERYIDRLTLESCEKIASVLYTQDQDE